MKTKSKQRWLALLMALVVMVGVLPTTAFAGADTQSNERTVETDSFWDSSAENEGHTHSDTCYCEGGELICTLEESEGHTHDENCYDEEGTLTCNLEESEGHIHNEECYCKGGELICGKDERDKDTSDEENLDPDEEKKALEQQDLEQQENTVDLTSGSASYKWFTVKINWVGDEGYEALRGTKVDLTVRNNPTTGSIGTFEAGKNWQREMYLPYEDDDGNLYHYTIDTTNYPLLHAYHIGDTKQEGTTITVDVVFQKTTDIDIDLTWDDFNDATGLRPANAVEAGGYKLCLSGSGEEYEASSVSEITDSKCTVSFKDIPTTYMDADGNLQKVGYGQYGLKLTDSNYYQLPNTVEVKTDSYGNKTLKTTAELKVLCKKINYSIRSYLAPYSNTTSWTAAAQRDIPVPKKIILTLLSDGIAVEGVDAAVFEANEDGTWNSPNAYSHTWYLPLVSDDGTDIDYGELSVKVSTDLGDLPKQYTQSPENITFTAARNESVSADLKLLGFEYVMADATWDDDNDQSGARPTTLSFTLLANGEPVGTSQTLTVGSNSRFEPTAWKYRPLLDSEGNRIHYTLQLNDLPAYYTASVTEIPAYSEDSGYAWYYSQYLENHFTFTLKKQSASATVKWEGDRSDSEAMARPDSVVLKLYYTTDNGSTWKEFWGNACYAVTQGDDANTWTYEWTALPAVDSEGNPVRYKAVQLSPGAAYTTSADDPFYQEDDEGNVSSTAFVFHNSYNDNWNYTINLSWNSENSAEKYEINKVTTSNNQLTVKYQLAISVQKPYEAGALEIRIPYELFDGRNGKTKGTVPSRFSIGDSSNPSSNYSITYRIDDKGTADTSDDEVIFYNYKDLSASENIQLTVEYTFRPFDVVDCTLGSLTATATGKYTGQSSSETQTSGPITCRLDTGVKDFSASKTFCQKVYLWPSEFGEKPDQFDMSQYNYVIYKLGVNSGYLTANQPSYLKFTDSPKDGGKVVAVKEGYINSSLPYSGSQYSIYEGWDSSEASATWQKEYSSYAVDGYYTNVTAYFVMVQYPRTSQEDALNPGQTTYETDYHNEAEFRFVAADEHEGDKGENDKNDVIVKVSDSTVHWTDYKFHYDGDLYSSSKSMNSFSTGALSLLQMGKTQSAYCTVSMTVNGYELSDGYRMDLTDDAVYARATINGKTTEYTRLTEEDYELSGTPGIQITCTDIDRSNGATIDGQISVLPFSLYGRKGNSGEWELLGQFPMTGVNERYKPVSDLTGLGYTALKIQSPGKLQGKYSVTLSGISVSIKSSSPVFSTWLENGDALTSVTVQNLAAYDLYETQKDSSERWINPYTSTSNSLSSQVGLDELDKMEFGAYRHRKNDGSSMYPLAWNSNISKRSNSLEYDPSAETVTVNFKVSEYEGTNTKLDEYPEEICQNGGTFYDLLPLGFVYDTSMGVEVYSYCYSGNTEPYAALEDLTVIDNYKDSGRQLLVVKVKSTREDGKNWSRDYVYTGFAFSYYAKASYDDVTSGKTLYNSVAFQRDDLKTISSCQYKEDGKCGYYSSNSEIWPVDESGVPVFYDINGDGIVTEDKNTLYAYTSFTPSIIQTIQNGLTKRVKGVSGLYHTDDVTGLGETYSYKLRLTAQKSGETRNVVIYDILEDAANTGGHTGEDEGWKGTFKGISTRNLKLQGIAPTVWYTTAQGLSYNDPDNLLIENKSDIWSTTPPDDLSTVTAIAFDLRKGSDGSDYVLAADQSVEMEIFMTAPSELQESEYAYNRPAYNATFRASNVQEGTTSFNISDRTTIALHDLQKFSFIKQYLKDDGSTAPLSGVTFKLYQCTNEEADHIHTGTPGQSNSCWGTTPVQSVNSDANGKVTFSELDSGTYAIYETSTRNGFTRISNQYWLVEVDAGEGSISAPRAVKIGSSTADLIEMTWNDPGDGMQGYYSLRNERPVRSIDVVKTWSDDSEKLIRPTRLTFDLYRNNELYDTKEVKISETSNSQTFKNIFTDLFTYDEYGTAYTYKVVERIPEGYTAENNGVVTIAGTWTSTMASFKNTRLGVLDVNKVVKGKVTDESFSFTVMLTDAEGKALDATTADGGAVSFIGRKFTTDASVYTEEVLALEEGGKLTFQLKDGETMRIIGLPVGTKWNASENANVHYTTTVSAGSVSGTASATEKGEVTFTNTVKKGKLTVSKIIAGNNADSNKSFAFTITLDDKNLSGNYGDMEFKDGAANFTLKGGESKTAEGLPSGTAYTVEEADYTGDGYVTTKKGAVGTIVGDDTVEAVFTNTRDKKSEKHHHSSHNDNTTTVTTDTSTTVNPPRTGDTSNAAVWIALILLSMMAIAGIFIRKKRDHQTE